MATIFSTDFEGYALGVLPTRAQSLLDNGWSPHDDAYVVDHDTHSGSRCVYLEGGALQRNTGYFGRSVTMQMWARTLTPNPTYNGGPSLQIANQDGVQTPVIMVAPENSTDIQLYVLNALVATASGVVSPNSYQKYTLVAKFSTVNAEGTDVHADGCVRCYVDDVLVIGVTDVRVAVADTGWATFQNEYDALYFDVDGYLDDVEILDDEIICGDVTPPTPPNIPPPDSVPCCGSGPDPTNPDPSSTPNPGNPPIPLQPWTPQCAGGGTVPFAADVTDLESWTL